MIQNGAKGRFLAQDIEAERKMSLLREKDHGQPASRHCLEPGAHGRAKHVVVRHPPELRAAADELRRAAELIECYLEARTRKVDPTDDAGHHRIAAEALDEEARLVFLRRRLGDDD